MAASEAERFARGLVLWWIGEPAASFVHVILRQRDGNGGIAYIPGKCRHPANETRIIWTLDTIEHHPGRKGMHRRYPVLLAMATLLILKAGKCGLALAEERARALPGLKGLAHRVESTATWKDLNFLPRTQRRILRNIAVHMRQRGKNAVVLFADTSRTAKMMGAQVLAREFETDLYRVDLSAVVSKYIGETGKNLKRVFDAAEPSGAILFFDEADALFGKRTEVSDSHDRYANAQVNYLLERMEAYRGLIILSTNSREGLDEALARRIRSIVQFSHTPSVRVRKDQNADDDPE
jgi:hypothetical protein